MLLLTSDRDSLPKSNLSNLVALSMSAPTDPNTHSIDRIQHSPSVAAQAQSEPLLLNPPLLKAYQKFTNLAVQDPIQGLVVLYCNANHQLDQSQAPGQSSPQGQTSVKREIHKLEYLAWDRVHLLGKQIGRQMVSPKTNDYSKNNRCICSRRSLE